MHQNHKRFNTSLIAQFIAADSSTLKALPHAYIYIQHTRQYSYE